MKKKNRSTLFVWFCLVGLALGVAGCQPAQVPSGAAVPTPSAGVEKTASPTPAKTSAAVGMPNPASVQCEENGGVLDIRQDSTGAESGVCVFPDGSECEEWAYYRGECQPAGRGPTPTISLAGFAFPTPIDPQQRYLFYLHGKIIEDQGLPAVSPDFGEYEYGAILQALSEGRLRVISEQRPKDTDPLQYAQYVAGQVNTLLEAGVPPENITVVGASKGGGIAIYVSNMLKNEQVNFVPMAICSPETVAALIDEQVVLYGNVLSIYDSADDLSGSCADLFAYSEGKGLSRHEEIVLQVGTGHGILYQPLDEWVMPVLEWAGGR
jgi:putative hemolysin